MRQQKCGFGAKCSYAHSQEEMDVWLIMKEQQSKLVFEVNEILTLSCDESVSTLHGPKNRSATVINTRLEDDIILIYKF